MHRYDGSLRGRLTANLAAHAPLAHEDDTALRRAAVCLVVVDSDAELHGVDPATIDRSRLDVIPGIDPDTLTGRLDGVAGGPAVLLTRRAATLRSHGGQWALPGGRVDPDESPEECARRELREELGLELEPDSLLGQLDDYPTRSGYVIRPFVFWGGADPPMAPDPAEVASVHRIAFRELARSDSPRFVRIPESERPVIQLPIGGDLIHAPTAAVLYQFRLVAIEGRSEPVHHYEQPVFAWR